MATNFVFIFYCTFWHFITLEHGWLESTTEILFQYILVQQNTFYLLPMFKLLVILYIIKLQAQINI